MNDKIVNNNHEVKMIDRCILNITGIKKIINFDNKEFIKASDKLISQISNNDKSKGFKL